MSSSVMERMRPAARAKLYYAVGAAACVSGTLVTECVSDFRFPFFLIFFPAASFLFFSLCHEIRLMIQKPRS